MVFPPFFNLSLHLAIRSSWSVPKSAPGLVFADCIELLHFWLQRILSISVLTIWWCSRVESSLVLLEEGVFYDQCILLAKLCWPLPLFCTPRPNLPVTPVVSWLLTFAFQSPTMMEKAMAPHSRTLAWKIPWTEEPGRLQSMGLLRVGHDWMTSLSLFTFMLWRRKWQPTPVFLPGESQGWGNLVGCRLWGHTESDMTDTT